MERSGVGRNYKRGRRSTKNSFFSLCWGLMNIFWNRLHIVTKEYD